MTLSAEVPFRADAEQLRLGGLARRMRRFGVMATGSTQHRRFIGATERLLEERSSGARDG